MAIRIPRGKFRFCNDIVALFGGFTLLIGTLVPAIPSYASDLSHGKSGQWSVASSNGQNARSHLAAFRNPIQLALLADPDVEAPTEPVADEPEVTIESDWLTAPPDPSRHNLWVPATEWAVSLALTIPLFMIDPAFVNVGPISSKTFSDAWTQPPVWDTDGHITNYLLHPIMGAEAYLMVRNRGYGPFESFLFSTCVSVGWEYLFEAWVEHPSAQDLLTTSPIGSLQGELRFYTRRKIAEWRPSVGRDALLILVDPIEALHRYVGTLFSDSSSDTTEENFDSSLNVGPDGAKVMITLRY